MGGSHARRSNDVGYKTDINDKEAKDESSGNFQETGTWYSMTLEKRK